MSEDKKKKGFAGLNAMVSDIEVPKAEHPSPPPPPPNHRTVERSAKPSEQPTASQNPPSYTGNRPSGGGSLKWGWILAILIVVLSALSNLGNNQPPPQSVQAPAPAPQNMRNQNPTPPSTATASASNRPDEVVPPIGDNMILTKEQIWYCLSEDIRLAGMRDFLNSGSQIEIDKFNAAAGDYNSRCSSFRYRGNALETAREKVELYRVLLRTEGAHRVNSWRQIATPALAPRSIPQETSTTYKEMERSQADTPKREARPLPATDRIKQPQQDSHPINSTPKGSSAQTSFPSYKNALDAVQALDKNGVASFLDNGFSVNHKVNGNALLVVAVRIGSYEMVEYIISRGADMNQKDSSGDSPMMAAKKVANPDARLINLLKDHGAINVCRKIIYTRPTWTTDCGFETEQ